MIYIFKALISKNSSYNAGYELKLLDMAMIVMNVCL